MIKKKMAQLNAKIEITNRFIQCILQWRKSEQAASAQGQNSLGLGHVACRDLWKYNCKYWEKKTTRQRSELVRYVM